MYDDPDLTALVLTRLAAEESEKSGRSGRAHARILAGPEQRSGPAYLELAAITLAWVHFKTLEDLTQVTASMLQRCSTPPRGRRWRPCSQVRPIRVAEETRA